MKILQVAHSFIPYNIAGTEVYTYRLSKELSKRNKVFVLFRVNKPKEKEYTLTQGNFEGIETYAINHTFARCNSFKEMYDNNEIDRISGELLDKLKPDVVHIQHLLFLSLGIVNEAKIRKIPVIFTLNDYWLFCHRGQLLKSDLTICQNYNKENCQSCLAPQLSVRRNSMFFYNIFRKSLPNIFLQLIKNTYLASAKILFLDSNKPEKEIQLRNDYVNKVISEVDTFIAPSDFIKDKFVDFGIPDNKIRVSSYGFYYDGLYQAKKIDSRIIRFGFIGTLLPLKGIEILLSAFKELKNKDTRLFVYGKVIPYSGYETYDKRLKKIAKSDKRVKLMGHFDNNEIGRIMSNMDLLVVPSIWLENSPLVIQEAFLSKTPVIVSRIGGMPELVNDGVNGLLVNPGDVNDLKNKLEYIINNPETVNKFKENIPGVKSIEENSREIEEMFNGLLMKDF